MTKVFITTALVAAMTIAGLSACTTMDKNDPTPSLKAGEMHFPVRKVDNLDDASLSTFRGDLVESDNCLYVTNVTGRTASKRYVVTWPSNARVEKQMRSGKKVLEVVSLGAEFNDNTRSVAPIPSRVEFLGMVVSEPFTHKDSHKASMHRDCRGQGYAPVRTWRRVGPAAASSIQ